MEAPITLTTQQQQENAASSTSTVAQPGQEERRAVLELVIGAIQKLLDDEQLNAFQIGKYVNKVVDEDLAAAAGHRRAKSCFIQRLKGIDEGNVSTLYKYARVAKSFSEMDAKRFGIFKLDVLLTYQKEVHKGVIPKDLGNHEVALLQKDGTTLMKKFSDCSVSELRNDLKRLKKLKPPTTHETALARSEPEPSAKLALSASTNPGPVALAPATNKVPPLVVRRAGKLVGLGLVVATVGEILRHTMVGAWIAGLGSAIFLWGVGMLVREWVKMHGQWMSALEQAFQPVLRGVEELRSMTREFRSSTPSESDSQNHPSLPRASSSQVPEESPTAWPNKAA